MNKINKKIFNYLILLEINKKKYIIKFLLTITLDLRFIRRITNC